MGTWSLLVFLSAVVAGVMVYFLPPPIVQESPTDKDTPREFRPASLDRPVPDFELIDQEGKKVTLGDLKGSYWVAGFIFTRCKGICPTVSAAMAREAGSEMVVSSTVEAIWRQRRFPLEVFDRGSRCNLSDQPGWFPIGCRGERRSQGE